MLHPGTKQPIGPGDLEPLFPMALILQEVSAERYIDIPEPIRDVYRMWRPSPLYRARRLEQALGTPAKIYYKYEGVSPAGSHKPNTAVPQAWYNKEQGIKKLSTETSTGQWGSSLAFAGALFGIDVTVFQVRVSYDQKPYRRALMETYGARCLPSPSDQTDSGRAILAKSKQPGIARHRHFGSGGDGGEKSRREIFARLGAQPRAVAPDCQRPGNDQANGNGRGRSRCDHWLHRRRLELAGLVFPFLGLQLRGGRRRRIGRGRARRLSDIDARQVRLIRLR